MTLSSIILFCTYLYGLGYTITRRLENHSSETTIMRIAAGLGALPVLGVLLNALRIPLDWRIFLIISVAFPLYDFILYAKKRSFSQLINTSFKKPQIHTVFLIIIFFACLFLYCYGSFSYPWFESTDPIFHATGAKYIAIEKNLNAPSGEFQYINPYPGGYDFLFGLMHQVTESVSDTLRFFNSLILSFGFLFFYYFAYRFTRDKNKALLATFFLACIPCYFNRFIWAHALAVTLFFPSFYFLSKSFDDFRFTFPSAIIIAGICLSQPTQYIKFFVMALIFVITASMVKKRIQSTALVALILSVAISSLWWIPTVKNAISGKIVYATQANTIYFFNIPKNMQKPDASVIMEKIDLDSFKKALWLVKKLFASDTGSATKKYSPADYLVPSIKTNPATGTGVVLGIFALLGILISAIALKKEGRDNIIYRITFFLWFIFTFLGLNSKTFNLPIGLFAYRFWLIFAIPVCIFATEPLSYLVKKRGSSRIIRAFFVIILISVAITSGSVKYKQNVGVGMWNLNMASQKEMKGYLWLKYNLKANTKVFAFTDNMAVIGFDMSCDFWKKEYKASFKDAVSFDAKKLHSALVQEKYEFLIITEGDMFSFSPEVVFKKLDVLNKSGLFEMVRTIDNSFWIFKIT